MSFLLNFLGGAGLKILGYVAIAGAVLAVLFGAKQAGRAAERVEGLQRNLENARVRREIDRDTAALDDDDLDRMLKHPSRRR